MPVDRTCLLNGDDLYVADVRCQDPPHGWTELRPATVFGLVMVRRGLFRGRIDGVEQLLDPATVYVERMGSEQQFAHPCGGDAYTELVLSEPQVAALLGGDPEVPEGLVFTTPRTALAQRLLTARARDGADSFELAERAVALAAEVLTTLAPARVASGRPGRDADRRRVVDAARAALAADLGLGLEQLGRAVGCSPHHLSRIFRASTGEGLARYRNRLRVTLALERLTEGETRLAVLAQELGFADQAHLTRVVGRTAGLPPGRLRVLLGPVGSVPSSA
ncbi:helix-turn-helix transcriptional regulator [Streptomyces sp. BE303]|uniref:helix-turn-helix transcriptional regulator n=1 Tax=Streptomyces sp. BE303 TaxID=3002528 RepID=UPI002E78867A|nr:helix-turn-helix transcriptional regulator [Streptomyces sp. BE303]MED7947455.1 helix-turn-helix transcriptional regulator [Streptomyces sp. BE303]